METVVDFVIRVLFGLKDILYEFIFERVIKGPGRWLLAKLTGREVDADGFYAFVINVLFWTLTAWAVYQMLR